MKLSIPILCFCCFVSLGIVGTSAAEEYKIRFIESEKEQIAADILLLALSKVDSNAKLLPHSELMTEARLIDAINENTIDVFWSGVSEDKEQLLRPIRIPILKGMLGHRILIIREADKDIFKQIKNYDDLIKYNAGQGTFWGDTFVLKEAGIPTVTTIKYQNLFPMLEGGRFDYFPRALHEPWSEVSARPELNLSVDSNVMLIYPYAMYFFVRKDNKVLHDKIYAGFVKAIEDGSYNELFFNHPMIKDALDKTDLANRTVIRLDNPYMHKDTPTERKEFWLDVDCFKSGEGDC